MCTLMAVCINAIFNYVFIFILDMGIAGAAWGTLSAQACALIIIVNHFRSPKSYLRFQKGIMKVRWDFIRSILGIGMSPFLINSCACLVVSVVNNSLMKYGGDIAVGAYGIVNRVVFVFVMVECGSPYTAGHTAVDVRGRTGKEPNVNVAVGIRTDEFRQWLKECVRKC